MGSDLDSLLVDGSAERPQQQRLCRLELASTALDQLLEVETRMALELRGDLRWLDELLEG